MALALGKTVRELLAGMDAAELGAWRRFYRRHPFGILRGDLQAWLTARNVLEGWSKGLRGPDRAALGMSRHPPKPTAKSAAHDSAQLECLSKLLGCKFTPGEAVGEVLKGK